MRRNTSTTKSSKATTKVTPTANPSVTESTAAARRIVNTGDSSAVEVWGILILLSMVVIMLNFRKTCNK